MTLSLRTSQVIELDGASWRVDSFTTEPVRRVFLVNVADPSEVVLVPVPTS